MYMHILVKQDIIQVLSALNINMSCLIRHLITWLEYGEINTYERVYKKQMVVVVIHTKTKLYHLAKH